MNDLLDRLASGADQLKALAPAIIAAGLILLTGYLLARQVQRWTSDLLGRWRIGRFFGGAGGGADPIQSMGRLLFWLVMLVVILLSSTALGFDSASEMVGVVLDYVPTLLGAFITVILGVIAGEFLRAVIVASGGGAEGAPTLGRLVKSAVVLISIFMGIQQLGVGEEIVTATFTLVFGAIALAAGLAFGLGNRELAGEITRRWFEKGRAGREPSSEGPPAADSGESP